MPAELLGSSSAWPLQSAATTMTMQNQTFETLSEDQLTPVTGGGIGSSIGALFGEKGAKWGAFADNILGLFQGGGAGGLGGIFGKLFSGASGSTGSSTPTPPAQGTPPAASPPPS